MELGQKAGQDGGVGTGARAPAVAGAAGAEGAEGMSGVELMRELAALRAQVGETDQGGTTMELGGVKHLDAGQIARSAVEALRRTDERFHACVDSMPDAIAIFSAVRDAAGQIVDLRYEYINHAGCLSDGLPLEQHLGRTLLEVRPHYRHSALFRQYCQVAETGEPLDVASVQREEVRADQKSPRAYEVRACKVEDGIAVIWRDITPRIRAQEAQRESEQQYRAIFDRNPDGVFAVDSRGVFILANPACEVLSGYSVSELIGRSFAELCAPESLEKTLESFRKQLQGQPNDLETTLVRKDGSRIEVLVTGGPVMAEGKVVSVCCTAKDISARKRAEAAILEAKKAADAANAAKDHFMAVLSHELRTPLTPILTNAQLLESDPHLTRSQREMVSTIRRNAEMETALIEDLLDLTRITHGKIDLQPVRVDLHQKIRDAVETCSADLKAKQLSLELELESSLSHVLVDPARIQQVLWNLIKNAVKFTPVGGMVRIATAKLPGNAIALTISDTGVGIEPAALAHIFEPFAQANGEVMRRFGGLGLGLAIARGLVQMHGGTITAQSEGRGRGARFTVTLPLASTPMRTLTPSVSPLHQDLAPVAPAEARLARILLVEDHPDTARAMRQILKRNGHSVRVVVTAAAALAALALDEFDLMLSDIGLPDENGLELLERVRKTRQIKAIAVSGYGMEEDICRSKAAGFAAHLTKPVDVDLLERTIQRVLAE